LPAVNHMLYFRTTPLGQSQVTLAQSTPAQVIYASSPLHTGAVKIAGTTQVKYKYLFILLDLS